MSVLRDILDLLHLRDQNSKLRLEIEKLKRDQAEASTPIVRATMADVEKYDPKVKRIGNPWLTRVGYTPSDVERWPSSRARRVGFGWTTVGLLLAILVAWVLFR